MRDSCHRQRCYARIAYLPQGLGRNLYPTLSVFENLNFVVRLFGLSAAQRRARIDDLLRSTGLDPLSRRQSGSWSNAFERGGRA